MQTDFTSRSLSPAFLGCGLAKVRNLSASRCECQKQVLSLITASLQFFLSSTDRCFWKKRYRVTIVFVGIRARKQQQRAVQHQSVVRLKHSTGCKWRISVNCKDNGACAVPAKITAVKRWICNGNFGPCICYRCFSPQPTVTNSVISIFFFFFFLQL